MKTNDASTGIGGCIQIRHETPIMSVSFYYLFPHIHNIVYAKWQCINVIFLIRIHVSIDMWIWNDMRGEAIQASKKNYKT